MKLAKVIAAAWACASAVPALAAEPSIIALEKSSDWVLDYGEERCSLVRRFGDGDSRVTLQIDSYGSLYDLRATVYGKQLPVAQAALGKAKYRLTPDTEVRQLPAMLGSVGAIPSMTFKLDFGPPIDEKVAEELGGMERFQRHQQILKSRRDFEDRTNSIVILLGGRSNDIELKTGQMTAPLKALRDCVTNLQESWGLDPKREERLQRPVIATARTVRRIVDRYPLDQLNKGESAFVPVRVMVDALGKPVQCVIQTVGPPQAFLDAVCEGLDRDFEPALDEHGQPVASIYRTSVVYAVQ